MYNQFYFFIIFLFFIPIKIPIIQIGSKPIDLVMSDFILFLFLFLFYFFLNKLLSIDRNSKFIILIIFMYIVFGLTTSTINIIIFSDNFTPIVSAAKFYKSMLFIIVGIFLAQKKIFIDSFDKNVTVSVLVISLLLIVSTFIDPRFPVLLWGESILGINIYGYPNSSMSFFAFISLFLLAKYLKDRQLIYLITYLLLFCNIVFSLSRSSTIVLIIGSFILLFFYMKKTKVFFSLGIFILLGIFFFISFQNNSKFIPIFELVNNRIERSLGNTENDASSGRFKIWEESIDILSDKPFLGHGFKPFSDFSTEYDTPHQQYLEVMHKTGILGFLIYSFIMIYMLVRLYSLYKKIKSYDSLYITITVSISGIISLSIGNLTQPNFSYSMIGNLIFLIFGIILTNDKYLINYNKKRK
jgi:O-antigen ligase